MPYARAKQKILVNFNERKRSPRVCLKKNVNASSRPSEHPPVRGKLGVKKRFGGIIGCKDKTSSWFLNGFPDGSNIG